MVEVENCGSCCAEVGEGRGGLPWTTLGRTRSVSGRIQEDSLTYIKTKGNCSVKRPRNVTTVQTETVAWESGFPVFGGETVKTSRCVDGDLHSPMERHLFRWTVLVDLFLPFYNFCIQASVLFRWLRGS